MTTRRLKIALAAVIALVVATGAFAYFTSVGAGTGTASVGSLSAATISAPSTSGASITVTWTAQAALTDTSLNSGISYTVERKLGAGSYAAIGSGPCSGSLAYGTASCTDTVGTNGTYTYKVIAHYHSWSATSNEVSVVATVAVTATKLVFTTSPQTITAGTTSGTITVEREDASNTPALTGTTIVNVSSSSGAGVFRNTADTTTISSVTISPGSSSASFKYRDTAAGTPTITAADNAAVLTSATQQETVNPASAATLTVSGYPASTVAGVSRSFSVTALDAFGNTATGYAGTVHFTNTNDAQAVLPANSTLTAGTGSFSATFKTVAGGTKALTATDTVTSSITGSESGIAVTPASAATLSVSGYPSSTVAGVSHSFSVTALDAFGNTATAYAGTLHFTNTNDAQAVLPANSTLTSGSGSFSATFKTVAGGSKTLIATDTVTSSITGSESGITVTSATAASFTVSGYPSSTVAGVTHSFSVTALDAFGNTATGYAGTVRFTNTNDAQAVLPADSTLTSGSGSFSAIFKTVAGGSKTLTATDTVTSSITGSEAGITVTPATLASFDLSPISGTQVAGSAFNETVTAKDAFGNAKTDYTGSVTITSNDGSAVLPTPNPYTFTTSGGSPDSGQHVFGVTLNTGGTGKTVTFTDGSVSITGTYTVNKAPAITSANSTTFTVGSAGSFTVTTTGFPTNTVTNANFTGCTKSTLPSGVTFADNANNTATLVGTPAAGSTGTYTLCFNASNGIGTAATQTFTLTVASAAITTTLLGSTTDGTVNTNISTVPSLTTTNGATELILVYRETTQNNETLASISGPFTGGTPVQITSNREFGGGSFHSVYAWRATGNGSTGAVNVTFSANKNVVTVINVIQLANNDTAAPIVQQPITKATSASASATLTAPAAGNAEIVLLGVAANVTATTPAGFIQVDTKNSATPGTGYRFMTAFNSAAQTSFSSTLGTSQAWATIALEIRHA